MLRENISTISFIETAVSKSREIYDSVFNISLDERDKDTDSEILEQISGILKTCNHTILNITESDNTLISKDYKTLIELSKSIQEFSNAMLNDLRNTKRFIY